MHDILIKVNGVLMATGKSKHPIYTNEELQVTNITAKNGNSLFSIGQTYMVGNSEFLFSRICTSVTTSVATFAMF